MKNVKTYFALALLLCASISLKAHAALITLEQTVDWSVEFDTTDDESNGKTSTSRVPRIVFDTFDASLGTLQDVKLSFTSDIAYELDLYARDTTRRITFPGGNKYDPSASATFDLNSFVQISQSSWLLTMSDPVKQSKRASCEKLNVRTSSCDDNTRLSHNVDFIFDDEDIAWFIDNAQLTLLPVIFASSEITRCNNDCSGRIFGNWHGQLNISYRYDDATARSAVGVPEPSTLVSLALGLLIFARKRQ
ncbi:PEP-CTERM sorting domain-containing protein [Aestuariibacter sp. AA17]|uniref:PEP-CTERM sorting domain-containing protein n=1 Tax=Fluctibacter corallii TaxID=2984329 RepID=A0ABT3ACD1_9ALTE|nr:PEP-CTERM sorting domain-containing protein [Aestuariibacter sp. AA17]MCV2886343.1 PEP-CTERM sorting domain-containing protein [Aestuariibacter sp. AA17]